MLAERRMLREHDEMTLAEHRRTLWAHFVNVALGAWLVLRLGSFDIAATIVFRDLYRL